MEKYIKYGSGFFCFRQTLPVPFMFISFLLPGKKVKIKDLNSSWIIPSYNGNTWEALLLNHYHGGLSSYQTLDLWEKKTKHVMQISNWFFNGCAWMVEVIIQGRANLIVIESDWLRQVITLLKKGWWHGFTFSCLCSRSQLQVVPQKRGGSEQHSSKVQFTELREYEELKKNRFYPL